MRPVPERRDGTVTSRLQFILTFFFSLLLTGDTTGGRQFLLFRWYLLLTGDITGRRPAFLLFFFTPTFHAWDQYAAPLIFSQWVFTNSDVGASVLASTSFWGPAPDEYVNILASCYKWMCDRQPVTIVNSDAGASVSSSVFFFFSPLTRTDSNLCTVSWTLYRLFFPRHYLTLATSDLFSVISQTRTWAPVPLRHSSLSAPMDGFQSLHCLLDPSSTIFRDIT